MKQKKFTIDQLAKNIGWDSKKLAFLLIGLKKVANKQDKIIEKFAQLKGGDAPSVWQPRERIIKPGIQSLIENINVIKNKDLSIYPSLSKCINSMIDGLIHAQNLITAKASPDAIKGACQAVVNLAVRAGCKEELEKSLSSNARFIWDLMAAGKVNSLIGNVGGVNRPWTKPLAGK